LRNVSIGFGGVVAKTKTFGRNVRVSPSNTIEEVSVKKQLQRLFVKNILEGNPISYGVL